MPEGDSIYNLAQRLAPVLVDREVTTLSAHRIADDIARSLIGKRITEVTARGKNLLVRFADGRSLHIHLRMNGRIFVERPRSTFWSPRPVSSQPELRLAVTGGAAIVGKHLPVCRVLASASQERRAIDLGPDLLSTTKGFEDEVIKRLRARGALPIAEALLIQRVVAGIGNVYKSEVLFLEGVDPRSPVSSIGDDKLHAIVLRATTLLEQNIGPGPRATRPTLGGVRLWVYGRSGRPCLRRCGSLITMWRQGEGSGRSTYACPTCQRLEKAL